MPSKADFQSLVDWCTQPSTSPSVKHSVGVHLNWQVAEDSPRAWEGNLTYIPPHGSRFWPEHFQGVLRQLTQPGGPLHDLNLVFAVGHNYAMTGIGAYEEYDVTEVTDFGGGILWARFQPYGCYLFNSVSWAGA